MTARDALPDVHSSALPEEGGRRLQECVGTLSKPGWEDRLSPLATHTATKGLVRARGEHGAHYAGSTLDCCVRH